MRFPFNQRREAHSQCSYHVRDMHRRDSSQAFRCAGDYERVGRRVSATATHAQKHQPTLACGRRPALSGTTCKPSAARCAPSPSHKRRADASEYARFRWPARGRKRIACLAGDEEEAHPGNSARAMRDNGMSNDAGKATDKANANHHIHTASRQIKAYQGSRTPFERSAHLRRGGHIVRSARSADMRSARSRPADALRIIACSDARTTQG